MLWSRLSSGSLWLEYRTVDRSSLGSRDWLGKMMLNMFKVGSVLLYCNVEWMMLKGSNISLHAMFNKSKVLHFQLHSIIV